MDRKESALLYEALCYEQGHRRRTQHIWKVYALASLLGERAKLSEEERTILQAGAILHDIAIQYCKEHCEGDACLANQKREAPHLVRRFLCEAGYPPEVLPRVIELVVHHHDYDVPRDRLLQLLMEADLLVNCYESEPDEEEIAKIQTVFQTEEGKNLFSLWLQERSGKG